MKDIFEQFIVARQSQPQLRDDEKGRMRHYLEAYMAFRSPVRDAGWFRLPSQRSSVIRMIIKDMAIALIVALVLGGGTSFAAQQALPGDLLYPVKIGVNEEVRAALALSAEARARWEAERANRRLEEAEQLAVKNRLDIETEASVQESFERHADRAQELAASVKMKKRGTGAAAKLNADFEMKLRGHGATLAAIAAQGNASGAAVLNLINLVKAKGDVAAEARAEAEAEVEAEADAEASLGADVKAAAEGKRGAARNKIAEVRAFMEKKTSVSAEARAKAEARLAEAERLEADGSAKIDAQAYAEASAAFKAAMDAAQEAKAFLNGGAEADVQVEAEADTDANVGGLKAKGEGEVRGGGLLKKLGL